MGNALIAITGAALLFYVFTTPGDQIALAFIGGIFLGFGLFGSAR